MATNRKLPYSFGDKDPDGLTETSHYKVAYAFHINNMGKVYYNRVYVDLIPNAFLKYSYLSLKLNHFRCRTISFFCIIQLVLKPSDRNER